MENIYFKVFFRKYIVFEKKNPAEHFLASLYIKSQIMCAPYSPIYIFSLLFYLYSDVSYSGKIFG